MIVRALPSLRTALLLLWTVALGPHGALADAVPPAPSKCPRGKIPITSHAGPECVEPPPKNCPPGWRPEIRGVCRLETCDSDSSCRDGKKCREVDLCLQEFLLEYIYGQSEAPRNRPLFAGPPMRLDPPRRVVRAVDVCGNGRSCAAPAQCGRGKVCLPPGESRPGVWSGPK